MGATGTATLDFGSPPGTDWATVTVTGQTGILSTSYVEAFFMADTTSDHSADEHVVTAMLVKLVCGNVVDDTGFDVYAIADGGGVFGQFTIRWVWV